MSERSFYERLGIDSDADEDTIEDAWRKQVKEHHPDVTDSDDSAEFKRIHEAYEVLSNAKERRRYDRLGHESYMAGQNGTGPSPDDTTTHHQSAAGAATASTANTSSGATSTASTDATDDWWTREWSRSQTTDRSQTGYDSTTNSERRETSTSSRSVWETDSTPTATPPPDPTASERSYAVARPTRVLAYLASMVVLGLASGFAVRDLLFRAMAAGPTATLPVAIAYALALGLMYFVVISIVESTIGTDRRLLNLV